MKRHRIAKITFHRRAIPLRRPFVISQGSITAADNVFARIETNTGLVGWGEACPFPYLVGETADTVQSVAELLRPVLLDQSPLAIDRLVVRMDGVIKGNATCKSMLDMALHDLAAQIAGLPLYAYLGGANDREIITDNTISIGTPEAMAATAQSYQQAGFTILKVKLGGAPTEDVARIRAIRAAVGEGPTIRIDANQGWSVPEAIWVLRKLSDYNIQHCEAPIPRPLSFRLPEIREQSPVPIMADEALFDHHDAARLAKTAAVDLFNIKLCKAGGIHKARKILAVAEAYGIPCQVGGMSESRLGTAAAAHFALSSAQVLYYDLDMPIGHREDPTVGEGLRIEAGGRVRVADFPGIGVPLAD